MILGVSFPHSGRAIGFLLLWATCRPQKDVASSPHVDYDYNKPYLNRCLQKLPKTHKTR